MRVDFDNDGDSDLLVNGLEAPPMLLRNDTETPFAWLGASLRATSGHPEAAGARILVDSAGRRQLEVHRIGSSYMSSEDPRHLFSLGDASSATVEIQWPGGRCERWPELAAGTYHLLVEGTGETVAETRPSGS